MFHQTAIDLLKSYEAFMALVAKNVALPADREIAASYAQILHNLGLVPSSDGHRLSADQRSLLSMQQTD